MTLHVSRLSRIFCRPLLRQNPLRAAPALFGARVRRVALVALGLLVACAGPPDPGPAAAIAPVPGDASQESRTEPAPSAPPEPEWTAAFARYPSAIAAASWGAVVFVGTRDVVALDTDGRERWRTRVGGLGYERPALDRDLVLVPANDGVGDRAHGRVVALDRVTGELRWSRTGRGRAGPVALGPDRAYAVTVSGDVTAYDRATGGPVWTRALPGLAPPGGNLALGVAGGIVASAWLAPNGRWGLDGLDAVSGARHWRADLGRGEPPSAAVAVGDLVVVGDGSIPALRAFDAGDGSERWRSLTAAPFDPASVPAAGGDLVAAVDRDGIVYGIDARSGRLRWWNPLGTPAPGARPVLARDVIAVATWAGAVAVLDPADGRVVRWAVPDGVAVALAATPEHLLVALRLADPGRVEAWRPP